MQIIIERFSDDKSSCGDVSGTEYFHKTIQNYRAAFDALDGAVMSLREKIISGLDEFPLEAVKDILPEYWDIRVKLEKLNETIGDHRARKDIGGNIGETLERFVEDGDILKLNRMRLSIVKNKPVKSLLLYYFLYYCSNKISPIILFWIKCKNSSQ